MEREAQDVNDELSQMKTKVLELEQKLTDKTDEFDKLLRRSESLSGKLKLVEPCIGNIQTYVHMYIQYMHCVCVCVNENMNACTCTCVGI